MLGQESKRGGHEPEGDMTEPVTYRLGVVVALDRARTVGAAAELGVGQAEAAEPLVVVAPLGQGLLP
jgi:hypothetical protein